ncbi:hypothetical protein B0H14DRAFT_3158378 [Mycena olivaceomarginata]|nr:hypothetical protein B0H14DRAFT_3158378 [Mycena olivaceomarginata]
MFKLLAILPLVTFLAGTVVAAPVFSDMHASPASRAAVAASAAVPQCSTLTAGGPAPPPTTGKTVLCTNTDTSAADFGGGTSPDDYLTPCSIVQAPDVGNPGSVPFRFPMNCRSILNLKSQCTNDQGPCLRFQPALQYRDRWGPAPPPPTGKTVICTNTDTSAADFGRGSSPDDDLTPCSIVPAPDVGIPCTNDQALVSASNPLCSTVTAGGPAPPPPTDFGGGSSPDDDLTPCSIVQAPDVGIPCTNYPSCLNVHILIGNSVGDDCVQYSEYWVSDVAEPTYIYSFHECIWFMIIERSYEPATQESPEKKNNLDG